jgi:diguanylate cyclase (GGDEF)-like protein/PAS domain S-box-containing protein
MLPDLLILAGCVGVAVLALLAGCRLRRFRARGRRGQQGAAAPDAALHTVQRQLAASEARFRDLAQLSSDWVWESDAQHRLSYLSDSVDAAIGPWSRGQIGHRPWELNDNSCMLAADWDAYRSLLEARQPIDKFEFARTAPDGRIYFLAINGRPVFEAAGVFAGYRGTGRNITREREQRILLELEGELAAVIARCESSEQVVGAVIAALCGQLGWLGGLRLERREDGFALREREGSPEFLAELDALPAVLAVEPQAIEFSCLELGTPSWLELQSSQAGRELAARYGLTSLGAQAALVTPLPGDEGSSDSVLVLLSPASFRNDGLVLPLGRSVSRTLSLSLRRAQAEGQLRHASLHDPLTGLPNRAKLLHALAQRLERAEPLSLLYIDLDRYKLINDSLGHAAGDRALVEIAERLRAAVGAKDLVARMGGDEFVVMLAGALTHERVEEVARSILAAIERPLIFSDRAWFVSASIGVASAPQDGAEVEWLLRAADSAMYAIKATGRNDVGFFSGELSDERAEQLELAAQLPSALERGEVALYYQPVMAIGERRIVCIEALLRWRHPERGMLLPERFLPAAEQSRLIRELGRWALRRALEDRARLGVALHPDLAVSLNVSAHQLIDEDFVVALERLLVEHQLPPKLLRLELTESAFVGDPARTGELIARLRDLGVRVVIDNFGTGYASLSYLKNLPVAGLKIDRAFVRGLPGDRGNAAIVQAITTMAGSLGMQAMAEGVETAAELRGLRMLECDQVQGSLIADPMPIDQLVEFLETLPLLRRMHRAA